MKKSPGFVVSGDCSFGENFVETRKTGAIVLAKMAFDDSSDVAQTNTIIFIYVRYQRFGIIQIRTKFRLVFMFQ